MIDKAHIRLDLGQTGYTSLPQTAWEMELLAQKFRYVRKKAWSVDGAHDLTQAAGIAPTMLVHDHDGDRYAFFRELPNHKEAVTYVVLGHAWVQVFVAADEVATADAVIAAFQQAIPAAERPGAITVRFWHYGKHGPNSMPRQVDVPRWAAVRDNYPAKVREKLEALLGTFPPRQSGQLILWHGVPGTGKTWALRALIAEWAQSCKCDYVTDSDNFFGAHPDYMMTTLFSAQDEDAPSILPAAVDVPAPAGWRLLVLEDAGELLVPDARSQVGQALSRLLNVVDGLVGQGLKVLVLITTNEPLGKVHPAVARPGRCAARIEFDAFTPAEADRWLRDHGVPALAGQAAIKGQTLADLYAAVAGQAGDAAEAPIGFAPAEARGAK